MDNRVLFHRFRYHLVVGFITPKDRVLEIGCGTGYGSAMLANVAKKVIAVEIDKPHVDHAKDNFGRKNIEFICADAEKMEIPECDVACTIEVLEHMYEPDKVIDKLKKKVKKYIVVSAPVGQKLVWVKDKKEWQEEHDSTHHSAFSNKEALVNLFVDDKWKLFHAWTNGVTCMAIFYNNENV